MTMIDGRTKQAAAQQIDQCLRALRTDVIDPVQIHEVIIERRAESAAIVAAPPSAETQAALSRLSRRSRDDRIAGRQQRAAQRAERGGVKSALARAGDHEQVALKRRRADRSCQLLDRMFESSGIVHVTS
jgi:hypothetical protein